MSAVALVTDLFFVSKIKSTADALGVPLKIARNRETFTQQLEAGVTLAIVDMNATGVDPAVVIQQCKSATPSPHTIAYLSHVQTDLAAAAEQAGADQVLPRSQFSEDLPNLLSMGQNCEDTHA